MKIFCNWRSSSIALLFLAASCQNPDPRLSECQQFIEIKQETDRIAIELSDNLQTKNKQKILQVADTFENGSSRLAKIQTETEKFLDLKTSFVQFYRDRAKFTRDYIAAFEAIDADLARLNVKKLERLDLLELKLVAQINSYCQTTTDFN